MSIKYTCFLYLTNPEELNKYVVSGVDAKGNKLTSSPPWIKMTMNTSYNSDSDTPNVPNDQGVVFDGDYIIQK